MLVPNSCHAKDNQFLVKYIGDDYMKYMDNCNKCNQMFLLLKEDILICFELKVSLTFKAKLIKVSK